jgi:hypothetical protein
MFFFFRVHPTVIVWLIMVSGDVPSGTQDFGGLNTKRLVNTALMLGEQWLILG